MRLIFYSSQFVLRGCEEDGDVHLRSNLNCTPRRSRVTRLRFDRKNMEWVAIIIPRKNERVFVLLGYGGYLLFRLD